jgi:molybdenum cofactor cytidylyltransferase
MKTELIMLAAGQSKRFGGLKQLAQIKGQPMICHCLSQYRQGDNWLSGIANGHVILGSDAELISNILPTKVERYIADSWPLGMGHSLGQSIQLIASDTTHVLIVLADQVALTQQHILRILNESNCFPLHIVAAKYANRVGVPAMFPREYFSQLSQLRGDKGARTLLQQHLQRVISIDIPEAALDIDTLADLNDLEFDLLN